MKGLLNFQDINLESRPNNGHGNHLAQWNIHSNFALWGDLLLLTLGEKKHFLTNRFLTPCHPQLCFDDTIIFILKKSTWVHVQRMQFEVFNMQISSGGGKECNFITCK